MVAGLPTGVPDTDFCPPIKPNTCRSRGSKVAPTKCRRPLGRRHPMYRFQSKCRERIHSLRNRHYRIGMRTHLIRKPAVMTHNGHLRLLTKVMVSIPTLSAGTAIPRLPPQPHLLSHGQRCHMTARRGHDSRNFMSGHHRVRTDSPFIVDHTQITVTDSAGLHRDFHLMIAQRVGIIRERLKGGTRFRSGIGVYFVWVHFMILRQKVVSASKEWTVWVRNRMGKAVLGRILRFLTVARFGTQAFPVAYSKEVNV